MDDELTLLRRLMDVEGPGMGAPAKHEGCNRICLHPALPLLPGAARG